jgi:hypothetical protein
MPSFISDMRFLLKGQMFYVILKKYKFSEPKMAHAADSDVSLSVTFDGTLCISGAVTIDAKQIKGNRQTA